MHSTDNDPVIKSRIVLHFPGFEPLDAQSHYNRYSRSSQKSAGIWDFAINVGDLEGDAFQVESQGEGWRTVSKIHLFDHGDIVDSLNGRPLLARLKTGYRSAARVVMQGAMAGYFRHAWRFGLFFLFPFLLVGLAFASAIIVAALPYWLGLNAWFYMLSLPLGALIVWLFFPWSERFLTLHLFSDWDMAVAAACLDQPFVTEWLDRAVVAARAALNEPADEYVISSHSMGSNLAAHVTGALLENDPDLFKGKRVTFVALGGAVLQCALLSGATVLRERVGRIARTDDMVWLEIHCLTDPIHFYKAPVIAAAGHPDAPQAKIAFIRLRQMLDPARYRRIKRDFLRVHRQYVLDADNRAPFDFTLMTAGPLAASSFAEFSTANMPPMPIASSTDVAQPRIVPQD